MPLRLRHGGSLVTCALFTMQARRLISVKSSAADCILTIDECTHLPFWGSLASRIDDILWQAVVQAEAGPAATSAFAPTAAVPAGPQPADQPQNGKPSAEGIQV